MQRSSDKIGALATALAKAQSEIQNPEKSLTAILPSHVAGGVERTYRYASLASGLELVRKCLGRHEIATVQTTTIDRDTGLIRLTTTLAHTSGEWMSSDWPVCPIAETVSPRRMGAALTYARRYALFSLVGIAGEDDLDAPDLPTSSVPADARTRVQEPADGPGRAQAPIDQDIASVSQPRLSRAGAAARQPKSPRLTSEASTDLRDQLLAELGKLVDASALTTWAHRALPRKNQLSNAHALAVEAAFANRLTQLSETIPVCAPEAPQPERQSSERNDHEPTQITEPAFQEVIVLNKPARERDRAHLKFVARQPCLVCGRTPSDAHHIKFAENWTVGRKVSDRFTVPLCRLHHHELHRRGNERVWWQQKAIEPLEVARVLWTKTHEPMADTSPQPSLLAE